MSQNVIAPVITLKTYSKDIVENAISIWFQSRKSYEELLEMFGSISPSAEEVTKWMTKQNKKELAELLTRIFNAKLPMLSHFSMTFDYDKCPVAHREQLVRHMNGTTNAYWATTSRIQDLSNFTYHIPPAYLGNEELMNTYHEAMDTIKKAYSKLIELGSAQEDAKFVMPESRLQRLTATHDIPYLAHIVSARCNWIAQDIWHPVASQILHEIRTKMEFGDLIADMMVPKIPVDKFQGEVDEYERVFGHDPLPPNPIYFRYLKTQGKLSRDAKYTDYLKPGMLGKAKMMKDSFSKIWTGEALEIMMEEMCNIDTDMSLEGDYARMDGKSECRCPVGAEVRFYDKYGNRVHDDLKDEATYFGWTLENSQEVK